MGVTEPYWLQSELEIPGNGCCQLISAINARLFWRLPVPSKTGPYIRELIRRYSCRYGSVLNRWAMLGDLDMESNDLPGNLDLRKLYRNEPLMTPLEVSINHPEFGFHSVLIVGFHGKHDYRVTGMSKTERVTTVDDADFENMRPKDHGHRKFFSLRPARPRLLWKDNLL